MTPYTVISGTIYSVVDADEPEQAIVKAKQQPPQVVDETVAIAANIVASPLMLAALRETEYWLMGASHLTKEEMLLQVQDAVKAGANI